MEDRQVGREGELLVVRGGVEAGLLGRQDVEAATPQVDSESGRDVTVEVQPDVQILRSHRTHRGPLFASD